MNTDVSTNRQQLLYRADPHTMMTYKAVRSHLQHICGHHAHQMVRIETIDGQVIEGRIVNCQGGLLYVAVPYQGGYRPPLFYGNDELILTLVLFELLVITLLYT